MYELEARAEYASPGQVARGMFDAWNTRDVDAIMSFYSPRYEGIDVGQAEPEHGLEGTRQAVVRYFHACPDLQITIEQIIVQGNLAVVCWVGTGTHRGHFMGIPPSGRWVSVRGTSTLLIEGGKIVRATHIWDLAGMLREIGLLPEL